MADLNRWRLIWLLLRKPDGLQIFRSGVGRWATGSRPWMQVSIQWLGQKGDDNR